MRGKFGSNFKPSNLTQTAKLKFDARAGQIYKVCKTEKAKFGVSRQNIDVYFVFYLYGYALGCAVVFGVLRAYVSLGKVFKM